MDDTLDLVRLVDCADCTVRQAGRIFAGGADPTRGGYLAALNTSGIGKVDIILQLGPYNPEKAVGQIELVQEKCWRLKSFRTEGHLTSYESRDPDNGKWGGAVYAGDYIFSFSGLPELWDEAAMLVLAIRLGYLHEQDVIPDMMPDMRNPHWYPLLVAMQGYRFPD
jgi:hypothetical protein